MGSNAENSRTARIQGQLLRLSARREVAIYLRHGQLWIADFIDGEGELVEPPAWFRFNCGASGSGQAQRRMARESAIPLSVEIEARIERLHDQATSAGQADDCGEAPE